MCWVQVFLLLLTVTCWQLLLLVCDEINSNRDICDCIHVVLWNGHCLLCPPVVVMDKPKPNADFRMLWYMHAYVYSQDKLTALFALVLTAFVSLHPVHSHAQNGLNPPQLVIVVFSFYEPKHILHLHLPLAMVVFPYAKFTCRCAQTPTIAMHCHLYCVVWVYISSQKTVQSVMKSFLRTQLNHTNTPSSN